MNHQLTINFSKISDYIYIGSNACCQMHFNQTLLKKGIRADIGLEKERIDQAWEVDYFLWLPTKDMTPLNPKQLLIGVMFIDSLIKNKIKVYIHCKNGHGRATLLTAAYFVYRGKSSTEALKLIKKKRPEIHLNKKQMTALVKFEKLWK